MIPAPDAIRPVGAGNCLCRGYQVKMMMRMFDSGYVIAKTNQMRDQLFNKRCFA